MKFRSVLILSAFLLLFAILSGCDQFSGDLEDQLSAPPVTVREQKVRQKISEIVSADAELVYANGGAYQNPINFIDIDGDGEDEVFVACKSASSVSDVKDAVDILIMKTDEDGTDKVIRINGVGTELDKISFANLDGRDCLEMIVGFVQPNDRSLVMCVYSIDMESSQASTVIERTYTDWTVADIDANGMDDIVYVYTDTFRAYSYARLIKCAGTRDPSIKEYVGAYDWLAYDRGFCRLTPAVGADGNNYVVVSYPHSSLLMSDEILLWNRSIASMVNISRYGGYESSTVVSGISDEYCTLGRYLPSDIDGDGVTEIPMCRNFDEATIIANRSRNKDLPIYLYNWYTLMDGKLEQKYTGYINEKENYVFLVSDPSKFENIRVYRNSRGELLFYYERMTADPVTLIPTVTQTLLFTVAAASTPEENCYILGKNSYSYFIMRISDGLSDEEKALLPTNDELRSCLICTSIINGDNIK